MGTFLSNVLRGGEPETFVQEASDLSTMRAVMEAHGPVWQGSSPAIRPRDVVIEYEDGGYETHAPLGIRLAQALYHGTDHRSQVCTALTYLGVQPPSIEAWDFAPQDGRLFTTNRLERPSPRHRR